MRTFRRCRRTNLAVAEIIGTILMLGLATSSFTIVYYNIKTAPTPVPAPIVEISGKIEDNQVILMHRGGEPLDLDTELVLNIGGKSKTYTVGDLLDSKSKENGYWDLSETLVYPIDYDFDYSEYPKIDINILDGVSNSLLMTGLTQVNPVCDIGVEVDVDNPLPGMETNIVFTITVTNNGNINETGILVDFILPSELYHYENKTSQGFYYNSTGIWNVGRLTPGQSEVLIVECTVGDRGSLEDTQLLMLLDGSGSIKSSDWTLQVEGLAAAIENEDTFPHDSSIELTIIQFGGGNWNPEEPGWAKIEIGPVLVDEDNYNSIANSVRNIKQLTKMTPTACGIYLGADTILNSGIFDPNLRQVVMMVTDGDPTQGCDCDGDYEADQIDTSSSLKPQYKVSAEVARDYLIKTLEMTPDQDEFDAIAVGESAPHAVWLKEKIVWPQPGYYAPPFLVSGERRGWLRNVSTWEEFAGSIDESFGVLFNKLSIVVLITQKSTFDPKGANDISEILVVPTSAPTAITKTATNIEEYNVTETINVTEDKNVTEIKKVIEKINVTFNMFYNFKWIGTGDVRFKYILSSDTETWIYTPWETKSGCGYYSNTIYDLSADLEFVYYRAQLKYENYLGNEVIVNVRAEKIDVAEIQAEAMSLA